MSPRIRFLVALVVAWGLLIAAVGVIAIIVGADLGAEERALALRIVGKRAASVLVISLLLIVPVALLLKGLVRRYVVAAKELSDHARIMLSANPSHRAPVQGAPEIARLAADINDLASAHERLAQDVGERVREANARLAEERNRLAALMSELAQSVVMCNIEGRILLYNTRAMHLLRTPVESAGGGRSPSLVGLGRSIFAIFDRGLITHALDTIHDQLVQGKADAAASFVTTAPAGQLVRVQMAPVLGASTSGEARAMTGFVLILDNITRRVETGTRRDALLHTLTQESRASLASVRAAAETIASFPEMDKAAQSTFIRIIGEEAQRLSARLDATVGASSDSLRTEWSLEDMRGVDLINAARRRIESRLGLGTKLEAVDESIWLKVDSYSLMQALTYLATRLRDEFGVREIRFGLASAGQLAHFDVIWTGAPLGFETTVTWQTDPMQMGGETSALTLQQIVERHNAEMWYQIDKASQRECFRIAIALTRPEEAAWSGPPPAQSRPEFYDFDLFHQPGQTPELDDQPLAALSYTVFDTETTGLNPSAGDEIVSIGAVRIVNGRLLVHEAFEQLVNPRRAMSPEASRVTGIESAMLESQPTIDKVLPPFAQFCEDTVLVAHNAAFDMRFLRLKEPATGVRFPQPVLDTLLLSAVIHPNLDTHGLESIAERMGVSQIGRHTALGDAIMTGEVFLRMIPLLAAQGIHTLRQAREASQQTFLARLEY